MNYSDAIQRLNAWRQKVDCYYYGKGGELRIDNVLMLPKNYTELDKQDRIAAFTANDTFIKQYSSKDWNIFFYLLIRIGDQKLNRILPLNMFLNEHFILQDGHENAFPTDYLLADCEASRRAGY